MLNVFAVFMTPCWRVVLLHRPPLLTFARSTSLSILCTTAIPTRNHFRASACTQRALVLLLKRLDAGALSDALAFHLPLHFRPPRNRPRCGHSGFEDHFQSDQYHYLHHQKFECNYGSPFSASIDMACGTFREARHVETLFGRMEQGGEGSQARRLAPGPKKVWSKHSYLGMPASISDGVYTAFWVSLFPLMYWAAVSNHSGRGGAIVVAAAHAADAVSAVGGVGSSAVNAAAAGKAMGESMRQAALRRTGRTVGRLGSWLRAATLRSGSGSAAVVGSAELYVGSLAGLPTEVVVAAAVAYAPIALALPLAKPW